MVRDKIVVNIYIHGEPSVGLSGYKITNTIEGLDMRKDIEECSQNGRREFRNMLGKFFSELLDSTNLDIWFDDECPDCLRVGCKGECNAGE